jgi:hypothetical protein
MVGGRASTTCVDSLHQKKKNTGRRMMISLIQEAVDDVQCPGHVCVNRQRNPIKNNTLCVHPRAATAAADITKFSCVTSAQERQQSRLSLAREIAFHSRSGNVGCRGINAATLDLDTHLCCTKTAQQGTSHTPCAAWTAFQLASTGKLTWLRLLNDHSFGSVADED